MKKNIPNCPEAPHVESNPVLSWWAGGIGIGLVLIVAVGLVQPIGVSTQYVVLDGVLLHYVLPDVASRSSYLAKTAQGWTLATYEFFFVLGIPLGALMAAMVTARFTTRVVPVDMEEAVRPESWESVGVVLPRRISPPLRRPLRRRLHLRAHD